MFAGQWEWFLAFVYSRIPLSELSEAGFLLKKQKAKPGGEWTRLSSCYHVNT